MAICCFLAHYSAGSVTDKKEALKKSYSPYSVSCGISTSPPATQLNPAQAVGYKQQKRKSFFLEEFTSQSRVFIFQSTWHWEDVTKRQP